MQDYSTYYASPLGVLEIRSDGTSITAILFTNTEKGNKVDESTIQLNTSDVEVLKLCITQLDEYFSGKRKVFDFPIDQKGTDFQKEVWQKLTSIPYGNTISYLDLSKKIGNPKAIRAVGTANGSNHIAIAVPCHRVIGSNGELTGYAGDLWRKKWLLEHEGKFENGLQTLF
ncbi:methylated-DNA--[protein]-cysteine S-methyltransferase [Ferruginibacter sp. SUN002]|uniref:methylated-DNA--[protein]-cysteine S-methyltransferase n=1 Tax=Ferruginibacter sp. SUN002 TaxID=2937789 RepID=UPI003D369BF1